MNPWANTIFHENIISEGTLRSGVALLLCLLVAACEDGPNLEARDGRDNRTVTRTLPDTGRIWLDIHDPMTPEVFMARWEADKEIDPKDPLVESSRGKLDAAAKVFVEKQRMIANRSVQLSMMLAEIGQVERPSELVDRLTAAQTAIGGRGLYGEMCQHYFNARSQGVPAESALAGRIASSRSKP